MATFGFIGVGAALAFAAIGSAIGAGAAGQASVGAWKKCYLNNRPAPFMLMAFVGAPLTQTIYGFLLLGKLLEVAEAGGNNWLLLAGGVLGGLAIGASALFQGKAAAGAADSFAETGKGFVGNLLILGLIETVALFVMVFLMISINVPA